MFSVLTTTVLGPDICNFLLLLDSEINRLISIASMYSKINDYIVLLYISFINIMMN